jgi:osmotically-inducible protein OsmY
MHKSVSTVSSVGVFVLLLGSFSLFAQDPTPTQQPADPSAQAAPDNTAKNQRDRNKAELTADQQKENKTDRELARQIRQSLVKDKSLSTYAHNIKVIAQNGEVTLKGPVKSAEEKQAIEAKAAEVAGGPDKIKSEIEVTGK